VLLEYQPYRKDDNSLRETVKHRYMAERGFATCMLDIRGTGSSDGIVGPDFGAQEEADGHAAVEWLAAQSWCSGRVGMWGASYGGMTSLLVAASRPPALRAVVSIMVTDDRLTDDFVFPGGNFGGPLYWMVDYPSMMVAQNAMPPDPASGAQWLERWKQRIHDNEPSVLDWIAHQVDGPFWRQGSLAGRYGDVNAPTLVVGGWRDGYPNSPRRIWEALEVPKRLVIGPWLHGWPDTVRPGPQIDYLAEAEAWFGRWLLDDEAGAYCASPVSVYFMEHDRPRPAPEERWAGEWQGFAAWPGTDIRVETYAIEPGGRLTRTAEPGVGETLRYAVDPTVGLAGGIWCMAAPTDQREDEARSLTFDSEPLPEALTLLGRVRATLAVAVSKPVCTLALRLADVAPDGCSVLITKAVLNLTRRDSLTDPVPLEPGREYAVTLTFNEIGWRLRPGHRLRLAVSAADWPNAWPAPGLGWIDLLFGAGRVPQLELPVLLRESADHPEFAPPPVLPFEHVIAAKPRTWTIEHDRFRELVTVRWTDGVTIRSSKGALMLDRTRSGAATLDVNDPACVQARSEQQWRSDKAGVATSVVVRSELSSTEPAFHVAIALQAHAGESEIARRSWSRDVPRTLL
jgi:putative CocE/NonD family hydrolase